MEYWSDGVLECWKKRCSELLSRGGLEEIALS